MPGSDVITKSLEAVAASLKEVVDDADAFVAANGVEELDKRIDDAEAALAKDAEGGSQNEVSGDVGHVRKLVEDCKVISDKHHGSVDGSAVFVTMDKNRTSAWFGPPALKTTSVNEMKLYDGATPDELVDHLHGHLPSWCGRYCAIFVFLIAFLTPLAAAGFMMHATYDAFTTHHRCTGPELTGASLQSVWFLGFFWILTWIMIKGIWCSGENKDKDGPALCCLALPFMLIGVGGTLPFLLSGTSFDGEALVFIFGLIVAAEAICMVLWPLIGPLIFLVVILNLETRVPYYEFDLYYGPSPMNKTAAQTLSCGELPGCLLTTSPIMDNWPSLDGATVANEAFEFPGIEIVNEEVKGGWTSEAPLGVLGLVDAVLMREDGWCALPQERLPDFIDYVYMRQGHRARTSDNITDAENNDCAYWNGTHGCYFPPQLTKATTGYDNCTQVFSYVSRKSDKRSYYDIKGLPGSYCTKDATMAECCEIVRNLSTSGVITSIGLCLMGIVYYKSAKEEKDAGLCIAVATFVFSLPPMVLGWLVYTK